MFTQVRLALRERDGVARPLPFGSVFEFVGFVSSPDQVCVEGRLYLEFMFDDMMRIKTWHFSIRQHREILPRSILAMHVRSRCTSPF